MESSEDSFGWTNTSSDKTESEACGEAMANEEESDFDKHYKKKLQKELFLNGDLDGSQEETPRRKKNKKIKREKESPAATVKQESDSDARLNGELAVESALRLKAERELAGEPAPRKRRRSRADTADTADTAHSGDARSSKKKKAKREPRAEPDPGEPPPIKKKKHKGEANGVEPILDKFEAEETVVEPRRTSAPAAASSAPAEKPFTSNEFVDTDRDSDSPDERRAPSAPAAPAAPSAPRARGYSDESDVDIVTRSPERSPKRALKIRERITYEEESPDGPAPWAPGARAGGRLARYLRAHAHLRAGDGEAPGAALGADDDVWVLRAPRSLGAAALAGAALALDARCKLKAGGGAYEAAPASCGPRAALLLPGAGAGWRARGVRVRGALQLRVRVPRGPRAPPAAPPAPAAVPLPPTAARHPLLGRDYERAPRPRPDAPDDRDKKKKKKKEKRKRSRSEAGATGAGGAGARSPSPRLPRGRAAGGAGAAGGELWDSAAAIEESLFNF